MKKLSCLLIALIAISGHAQKTLSKDYAFKVSEPYKVVDAKNKFYFSEGNEALAIKFDGGDITIQKFDSEKPAFIKAKVYEKFFPKNYEIEDVLKVGNKYYVFFSSWDGDHEQMFSQEFDFASGEFVGTPKLMFQVDGKVTRNKPVDPGKRSWAIGIAVGGNKFDIVTSYDRNNLLIQYRKKPEVKNDKKSYDIIGLCSFNGSLEKQSISEVKMPYTERRMNNLDYKLDNKGDLFLLTKVFHDDSNDDKKSKKDTVANYHIELFKIKSGSDKIEISQFDNKDKFINGLWIFDTSKDYLVCGGYYSNGKGKINGGNEYSFGFGDRKISPTGESDGIVVFKIKNDGTIYDQYFHEIPLEVLNAFESKRTVRKNEKKEDKGISAKIPYLVLRNIGVQDDGSMMLIGEQYYMEKESNSGGFAGSGFGPAPGGIGFGNNNNYYSYHYEDILATKIAADGSLSFMKKIPKKQKGMKGLGGMSYKYFFANNNHYFVFLDNVKNIDLPEGKTPAEHSDGQGGYLTAVKISDADGTLKKGSILNAREVDDFKIHQFSTNRIMKTSESSFMVEAYKKQKEDIMIKINLN